MKSIQILVIGTGYVGLVAGTCFAEMGNQVVCLDINQEKIEKLQKGVIPIYEPGLEEMVKRNLDAKRLHFTTDYASNVPSSTVCFIAVDTPMTLEGTIDLKAVHQVATQLAHHMTDRYTIIVTKSTVPVGTATDLSRIISKTLKQREIVANFDIVSNPEFLKEGNAIQDFMKPDRVIIGSNSSQATEIMKNIYTPFMVNHEKLLIMDVTSAELSKYAANAMLATRISFMNEMAGFCELVGANIDMIRHAIGSDPRIGNKFLYAGPGYGGSCLPKDIKALQVQAQDKNYLMPMIQAVDLINHKQKEVIGQKIHAYFEQQGGLQDKVIGILGLAFKPDTDDIREAASLTLIHYLLKQQASLRLFDPIAMDKTRSLLPQQASIQWCQNEYEAATGADAIALITEWKQFRCLNMDLILSHMRGNAFFDGRNQYKPEEMARKGFNYFSIGRQPAYAAPIDISPNVTYLETNKSPVHNIYSPLFL